MGHGKTRVAAALLLGLSLALPSQSFARGVFHCGTDEAVDRAAAETARAAMMAQRLVIRDDGKIELVSAATVAPPRNPYVVMVESMREQVDLIRGLAASLVAQEDEFRLRRSGC